MVRVVGIDPGTLSIDVCGMVTVLDHLIFVPPAAARRRLGIKAG